MKNFIIYWCIRPWILFFSLMPLGLSRLILAGMGGVAYYFDSHGRNRALKNLQAAFSEKSPAEIKRICRGMYRHFGICVAELVKFRRWSAQKLDSMVTFEGFEHLENAFKKGKGVLGVTGHLGNWELMAAAVAHRLPVAVIGRAVYDERLNNLLNSYREAQGYTTFSRQASPKPILKALKEGKVVGVLCDQDTGVESVFADFFGRPASTPAGPAILAQHTGAALVPFIIRREADGRYKIIGEPEISVGPDNIQSVVQQYTSFLEKHIRNNPEQWVWVHDRWKTKPVEDKNR